MGIYLHIPFCQRKCSYCDFYSLSGATTELYDQYTDCLIRELTLRTAEYRLPLISIYFGGGTPSLLAPQHIERILDTICKLYLPQGDPEITLEVNPATISRQGLEDLRQAGVNRLSIGVQSFVDRELHLLGRMHDSQQAGQCIEWSHQAGFDNISLDLIYGIPAQNKEDWRGNLLQAVDYGPQHISTYLLQLEPHVPLARRITSGTLAMLTDDEEADLYDLARECLREADYLHYELSNFARPGFKCRHNIGYWSVGAYLGVGAGAVSYDGRQRRLNIPDLEAYLTALSKNIPLPQQILETMGRRQQLAEALVMGLRLVEGIDRDTLGGRFGIENWADFQPIIDRMVSEGLLMVDQNRVYLSPGAYFISNAVLSEFLE